MNLKAAAIDIGTNSCRLLIGEIRQNTAQKSQEIIIKERKLKITRLGEGVDKNKMLNKKAVERVFAALKEYKKIIEQHDVEKIRLVGTSALRDVNNSELLEEKIVDLGINLEIISGRKEAELNYLGAADNLNDDFLLIDIGGGSTEFVWPNDEICFKSLDIGCVRMTERFIDDPSQALKYEEVEKIRKYVSDLINSELDFQRELDIKGVGGTITTLAALKFEMEDYESEKIEGSSLDLIELESRLKSFQKLTLAERASLKGLQPKRADIISAGLIILIEILKYFSCESLTVSDKDLLYGLLKAELLT